MAAPYYTTLNHIFTNIRNKFGLDSTTLPDSTLLPYAQKRFREMLANIYKLNRSYYADILIFSLVPDQIEYTKQIDSGTSDTSGGGTIKILRLEVSYSGKTTDWVTVNWIDEKSFQQIALYNETEVNAQFSVLNPAAYELDKSFFLLPYPTANASFGNTLQGSTGTNQGYFWCIVRPTEFTDNTTIPNIDKEFLGVLEDGIKWDVSEQLFGSGSNQATAAKTDYIGTKDQNSGVTTGMAAMIEAYANKDLAANWKITTDQTISMR